MKETLKVVLSLNTINSMKVPHPTPTLAQTLSFVLHESACAGEYLSLSPQPDPNPDLNPNL